MKKTLRNLMLAGAAALLATGASAQTLEKVWDKTSGVPGAAAGGDMRFMTCDKDGKILVNDKAANKIKTFNAIFGAQDYYDLSEALDTHYGKDVTVIDKIDTTVVAEGDTIVDTVWKDVRNVPAVGTLIASDDAGNILVNTGFPNAASATDFIIISADLKNTYKLQLKMPEGITAVRCDQMGRIVGDMLGDEGAYMWIINNTLPQVAIVKVVAGVQDMDYTQASTAFSFNLNTSCVAQPLYYTVAEIDALMEDLNDLTPSFWLRNRSFAQDVYQWNEDGTEAKIISLTETTEAGSTTKNASQEGFEVINLQGETYFVVPMSTDGSTTNRSSNWGIYRASDQKLVAAWEEDTQKANTQFMGGFYVKPVDETSVHISHFIAGTVVGTYLFTVPKAEEPTPAVDPLYIFGSFQGWTPAEALELAYADGVYTIEDIEFGEGGNFGLSTVKSDVWADVNAARYGFATDNAKAVVGENAIVKGEGAIQVPYAGVWDITVDLANLKLTLATETPEPQPEPEPVVIAPGLNKVWENTAAESFPDKNESRFASAKDGKIIINNKAEKKIMAIDENGLTELVDLAEAIDTYYGYDETQQLTKVDSTVTEDTVIYDTAYVDTVVRKDPGLGTAITVDDAGNILVNTGFPNAGSSTDFIIVSADLQNTYKLQITMPEGVTAARMDQMGRVRGNMLSDEGAYLFITPNELTQAAIIKVVNGEQDVDMSQASGIMGLTFNSTTLAQPMNMTVEEIDALMDEYGDLSLSFYVRSRSNNPNIYGFTTDEEGNVIAKTWTMPASESGMTVKGASQEGFETFTLKGVNYFIVPLTTDGNSSNRCTAFAIFTEKGGKVEKVATYEENAIITGSATNMSIIVVPVNDEAVEIYHYAPALLAAKYTFALEKEAEYPAELYMLGYDNNWDPANPTVITMTETAGVYEATLEFANNQFKFSEAKGSWDEFDAKAICIANDVTVELNNATPIYKYSGTNCKANVEAGKEYTVTIDLVNNTITIKEASGVEGIEVEAGEAVYYNLQGVKVANPENGVFIKVQGNKASKVLVK